ncbi:MAG: COG3014 family protein [Desulfuromonadaceae bacterium]
MNVLLKGCRQAAVLATLLVMSGCASTSTFTAYPRKIQPLIASLANRTPIDLSHSLQSESKSNDRILYSMERGRYAQVVEKTDISMADFKVSMEKIRENDEKALISASAFGANVAATMVNDNAIPYAGEGYERVLLHHYQALNYLKKKDIEGAGVEVRRANAEQDDALRRFEDELDEAREEAANKRINSTSAVESRYAQMDEVAGKVKNSFQNAYTFYVSAFIYELLNQPDDAYIDYKKALEIYPDNSYLQKDVVRLAVKLGRDDELDELQQRFALKEQRFIDESSDASGELLVLFEDGFVPQKREIKIPLPAGRAGLVTIAFPIYEERWSLQTPLRILNNNVLVGSTEPICDVRALAVKALKEKAPVIATRQIIRAVAKGVAAAEARKQMGDFGLLATNIWNILSENADLRSWLTLPSNAQILRTTLPAGHYQLALQHPMGGFPAYADVDITPAGKTVLQVVRAGGQIYSSATSF